LELSAVFTQAPCPAPLPPPHVQAQHMVMDTLAVAVSASANYFLRHKEATRLLLPLVAFPICGAMDLICIYRVGGARGREGGAKVGPWT